MAEDKRTIVSNYKTLNNGKYSEIIWTEAAVYISLFKKLNQQINMNYPHDEPL